MSNIKSLLESIKSITVRFTKNPNRTFSSEHLLKTTIEVKTIKNSFQEAYLELSETDSKLALELKEAFNKSCVILDNILDENINKTLTEKDLRNNTNMTSFDITVSLKVIPEFQGEPKNLNNFLNLIEFLYDDLKDSSEKEKLIKFVLKTRLAEKVKNKLSIVEPPKDLASLKITLQNIFKTEKTPLKIQSELSRSIQGNRNIRDYATHVENLVAQLNSIQIAEQGEAHRVIISKLNDQIGLNAFKNGLQSAIKSTVFAATPKTLQEAVKIASETETTGTANIFHYNRRFRNPNFSNRNRNDTRINNNFRNNNTMSNNFRNNAYRNNANQQSPQNGYSPQRQNNFNRTPQNPRNPRTWNRPSNRVNVLQSGNEAIPEGSGEH